MRRWSWNGHARGRTAVCAAVESVVNQFAWRPLERLEQRVPVAGPIAVGASGLWLDQPWQGLQDEPSGDGGSLTLPSAAANPSVAQSRGWFDVPKLAAFAADAVAAGRGGSNSASSPQFDLAQSSSNTSSDFPNAAVFSQGQVIGGSVAANIAVDRNSAQATASSRSGAARRPNDNDAEDILALADGATVATPLVPPR